MTLPETAPARGGARPDTTSLYFANLAYPAIAAAAASDPPTVLFFPVGSTEPHGPHSPLCTDPVISLGMCERACLRLRDDPELRGLILPLLPYGVTRYTASFGGAIHVREETLHALVVDVCRSLLDQGFRHVVLVNNHFEPEHVQTLHRAADDVERERGAVVGYLDLTRKERATRLTEEFRRGECHAGRYETSLVLADRPELVDRGTMVSLAYVPVNLAQVIAQGMKEFTEMGLESAYCGSPAEATAEEGEESFAVLTEMLVELARELVRGTGGRDRSGLFGRV
ncbi:MAG: creatininase family protein [Thermoleophilia bacterium]|nr:creatininase family protein [Thermoleophilia bacterium]